MYCVRMYVRVFCVRNRHMHVHFSQNQIPLVTFLWYKCYLEECTVVCVYVVLVLVLCCAVRVRYQGSE